MKTTMLAITGALATGIFAVALAAAGRARSSLAVRLADSASAELGREG